MIVRRNEAVDSTAGSILSTETEIICLAQGGDAAAFENLYRLHHGRIYCLCLRMVRSRAEAEDLTQEAFLQVFRKIHTFRAESSFSTWLHRLTVNIVLMRLRIRSLVECSVEELSEQNGDTGGPLKEFGTYDLSLNGVVDRLSLQRAVDELPPGYKQMFILHDLEGYEHHEIAKLLGCSTGNTKSQLFKARLRLRDLLKKESGNRKPQKRGALRVSPEAQSLERGFRGNHNWNGPSRNVPASSNARLPTLEAE